VVSVKVTVPIPAVFHVSAKFNADDGVVSEANLDNLSIHLSDLLLPASLDALPEEAKKVRSALSHYRPSSILMVLMG
jgi:hypothetical protein